MFKIYVEPESPNERALYDFKIYNEMESLIEGACVIYNDPESPHEGACLGYMLNRNRQMRVFQIYEQQHLQQQQQQQQQQRHDKQQHQ